MKILLPLICLILCATPAFAQETELDQETKAKLEWLEKFVGNWEVEHEGVASGTMKCVMVGDHWLMNDFRMKSDLFDVRGIQTIGYDPEKKKYVGTWIDSMTGYMWHYAGEVDESGKKLTLEAVGPGMTDPEKTMRYRDAYEFSSADHIIATSSVENEDGTWTVFMKGTADRAKDED